MTTPIVDFVRQYAQSGTARLHMPGHKGQSLLGCEPWDITEIRGADELYEAEGIIAQSEANATRLFGTAHTYYSTEGSSQCIRAMLCLAMQGAPRTGKRPVLLAARNAHKALLYAAALLDFDIRWLWPAPEDTGALCSGQAGGRRGTRSRGSPLVTDARCFQVKSASRVGSIRARRCAHCACPCASAIRSWRISSSTCSRPRCSPCTGTAKSLPSLIE